MMSLISSKVGFGFILKPFSVNSVDAPSEQFEIQILHGKFHTGVVPFLAVFFSRNKPAKNGYWPIFGHFW